jgi:hypothetical protein
MVLFFLFPRFLWYTFPRQGGVNIRRLVRNNRDEDKGLEVAQRTLKLYLDAQTEFQGTVGCNHPCRTSDKKQKDTDEGLDNFYELPTYGWISNFFRLIERNTDEIVAGKIIKYLHTKL